LKHKSKLLEILVSNKTSEPVGLALTVESVPSLLILTLVLEQKTDHWRVMGYTLCDAL
jgi:hypothetical protein